MSAITWAGLGVASIFLLTMAFLWVYEIGRSDGWFERHLDFEKKRADDRERKATIRLIDSRIAESRRRK